MRLSELLALRKKDFAPPFVPLATCWSVVIGAFETGVSTKTEVRDGSVFVDQRWLQWSASSCPHSQGRISGRADLEFSLLCSSTNIQDCNRHFGTQRHDHVPNTSQWSQHRPDTGFQNSAKSAKTRAAESFQQCHKIQHEQSIGGRLPLSLANSQNKLEILAPRVEVLLTERLYVWRLTNASTTHFVLSQRYSRQCCCTLVLSFSHAVDSGTPVCASWSCDVLKIPVAAQLRMAWALRIFLFTDHSTENERCFWFKTWTTDFCTVLLENVLGQVDVSQCFRTKTCSSKGFPITLRVSLFT